MRAVTVLVAVLGCSSAPRGPAGSPLEANIVVHARRMVDVARGAYVDDVAIAILGNRIVHVGRWELSRVPSGVRVVELDTVLPGLVDAHVHLAGGATTDGSIPGAADAEKTLRAGVTTVRDLGSTDNAGVALRGAIINGAVRGPRMIVAGAGIGAAGGACDQVFGQQGRIATPEDAVRVVDEQAAAHVDVIKICTGGGVLPRAADA